MYPKTLSKDVTPIFSPDDAITTVSINEGIHRVLTNLPKKQQEIPKKLVKKVVSIEEVIENLTERVTEHFQTSFKELKIFQHKSIAKSNNKIS